MLASAIPPGMTLTNRYQVFSLLGEGGRTTAATFTAVPLPTETVPAGVLTVTPAPTDTVLAGGPMSTSTPTATPDPDPDRDGFT